MVRLQIRFREIKFFVLCLSLKVWFWEEPCLPKEIEMKGFDIETTEIEMKGFDIETTEYGSTIQLLDQHISDPQVTAVDIAQELEAQEMEAQEAFPYDPSMCFFDKGPVNQLVYSCITCSKSSNQPVGVCYGCFISCHTTHSVHELFYQRDFQCDCGTEKSIPCSLSRESTVRIMNHSNSYGRNFQGINCYCGIIHDPEVETREMVQCLHCQDWFHDSCLSIHKIPDQESFDDFLCRPCLGLLDNVVGAYISNNSFENIDTTVISSSLCRKPKTMSKESKTDIKGYFLPLNWRNVLCKCIDCMNMYGEFNISSYFLQKPIHVDPKLDSKDTTMEAGLKALFKMDRIKALDSINHFQDMKQDLTSFLRSFSESGKVVTREDINAFFSQKQQEDQQKKRQRIN